MGRGNITYIYVFTLKPRPGACVLTVGISPTKSMSTKNPKLGKTFLQVQTLTCAHESIPNRMVNIRIRHSVFMYLTYFV